MLRPRFSVCRGGHNSVTNTGGGQPIGTLLRQPLLVSCWAIVMDLTMTSGTLGSAITWDGDTNIHWFVE